MAVDAGVEGVRSLFSRLPSLLEDSDPATASGYAEHPPRMGFFTDTTVCIGCKACEVACKEWNHVPEDGLELSGMSYDNTVGLGADTWRHVAFIEQPRRVARQVSGAAVSPGAAVATRRAGVGEPEASEAMRRGEVGGAAGGEGTLSTGTSLGGDWLAAARPPGGTGGDHGAHGAEGDGNGVGDATRSAVGAGPFGEGGIRWLMASDVCKHCTHAACLDVCPTGALFRTEFGTVVVQEDICNGCGYCIPACPYGVIDQRRGDGRAWKCTLCYDRISVGVEPACAKTCPTDSIQFGILDELRERADRRLAQLHAAGVGDARLYGRDPADGVGGDGAFFLLLDEPEVYGLPPDPVVTTRDLPEMWARVALAALALLGGVAGSFLVAGAGSGRGGSDR